MCALLLAAALGTDPKFLILNKTSVIPMAVCGHFAESVIHNFSFMKGQVEQCRGLCILHPWLVFICSFMEPSPWFLKNQ